MANRTKYWKETENAGLIRLHLTKGLQPGKLPFLFLKVPPDPLSVSNILNIFLNIFRPEELPLVTWPMCGEGRELVEGCK